VTSLEYALMASSIALFIITAVFAAGAHISSWYTTLANTNW
jgi:Flp pilus assembly pilin Flp